LNVTCSSSPVAGVLLEIKAAQDSVIPVGGVMAVIGEAGSATPSAPAPAAPATEPAANKPSADAIKQAQLKKNLMKNQQARTAQPAAPSGFSGSGVGQARQRTYAGTGGAPKSYTVREGAEFYSKFLGKNI
jgi:pyruvate/2-oxoglutarate dehydrogenase complex dihydrolipoamide acyltransferase (E2) component